MTEFRRMPGQEGQTVTGSLWPSSNRGWRLAVASGSALILLSILGCVVLLLVGG